jgi:predicted enzyme related to lactoylglutathione lyase
MFVENIRRSEGFYRDLLGIEPCESLTDFSSFELSGTYLNLHLADIKSPLSTGGSVGYITVPNLQNMIQKALALGAEIWRGPLTVKKDLTIVQIKDPYGNILGFEQKILIS